MASPLADTARWERLAWQSTDQGDLTQDGSGAASGRGFVAGGVLGASVGIAAFALVPALVLAMLSLGVGLWLYRKIAFETARISHHGPR